MSFVSVFVIPRKTECTSTQESGQYKKQIGIVNIHIVLTWELVVKKLENIMQLTTTTTFISFETSTHFQEQGSLVHLFEIQCFPRHVKSLETKHAILN